ncbi:putative membrane protein YeiH [Allocatelliglobosispora scoriae]|uniref:Putative membrane protein YeiH n=1 Tax=Allocatelliglobosispora scoriae TaxID=643052 RepID=A0A841BP50_9ACTN|nr:TRIC cation channel family protein [Allocatelliglobosispora scoriae]MBB5869158.1 putative membrane protein YeiH [Allocatelliglobosispora scoriae]
MLDPVIPVALPYAVDITAVALGAAQGALFASGVAPNKRIDLIGVLMIGIATGMGGGIVRDLLLNLRPVALEANSYIAMAVLVAVVSAAFANLINRLEPLVVAFDALALGLYLVVGISKALSLEVDVVPAVFIGILSCTAGSVIRDLLMGTEVALVTVGSFYAFAAIGGALAYLATVQFATPGEAAWAGIGVTFAVRMLSVWFGWSTPHARALSLEHTSFGKITMTGVDVISRTTRSGFLRSREPKATVGVAEPGRTHRKVGGEGAGHPG